jgi:hypothetical protein
MPDAQEYITVKAIAHGIHVLSTDSLYPVSVWQLHGYLAENCEEARGEASSTFFKTQVPKALDQMVATCMLSAQPEGLRLTKRGRRILLEESNATVLSDQVDNHGGVREAMLCPIRRNLDCTKEGQQLVELVRAIWEKRRDKPPFTCPGYVTELYMGSRPKNAIGAGDTLLPHYADGSTLPGDKAVLIKRILDALVQSGALILRKRRVSWLHRKVEYYEVGANACHSVLIELED